MGYALDGRSWVKNETVSSSAGSIQNVVLAAPQPVRIQAYLGWLGLGLELAHRLTLPWAPGPG
jgi:hypothetical protein